MSNAPDEPTEAERELLNVFRFAKEEFVWAYLRAHVAAEVAKATAELLKDKERLDWLTKFAEQPIHCCWLQFHNAEDMGYSKADKPVSITVKPFGRTPDIDARGETLRAAIDAARAQQKDT